MLRGDLLVSIVIPVYNGADYLAEAIESALVQTYTPCEVIVVNDGSADGGATEAVALKYGERIRYISKPNGGVASALNFGIKEMKGQYFSWLSHDDAYLPDKLDLQMETMKKFSGTTILYSNYYLFDKDSKVFGKTNIRKRKPDEFIELLLTDYVINGCTMLIPGKAFDEVGGFNEKLKTTQDADMWFRLNEKHEFRFMEQCLVKYRMHPNQGSARIKDACAAEQEDFYVAALKRIKEKHYPINFKHISRIAFGLKRKNEIKAYKIALRLSLAHIAGLKDVLFILCSMLWSDTAYKFIKILFPFSLTANKGGMSHAKERRNSLL
jgi:glycosyltransferase involved in cell wall biosynthesis